VRSPEDASKADFQFTFIPSRTTLFRFSAITFNAHRIHLDPEFCRHVEGHPDCLVHGPLTALLLLDLLSLNLPPSQIITSFEYRATHPLVVEHAITLNGTWGKNQSEVKLWAVDDEGRVGMTAHAGIGPKV